MPMTIKGITDWTEDGIAYRIWQPNQYMALNPDGTKFSGTKNIPAQVADRRYGFDYLPVTKLGANLFNGCSELKETTISANITEIENNAFNGCTSLEKVNISDVIKWMKVKFGSNITSCNPISVAGGFYMDNLKVTDLILPECSDKTIFCGSAFYGCTSLQSVKASSDFKPTSLSYLFENCSGLKTAEFYYLNTFGEKLFKNCTNLSRVTITSFSSNSVDAIMSSAFEGCEKLEEISLMNNGNKIPFYFRIAKDNAFKGCKLLQGIDFSKAETIGASAFEDCKQIREVIFSKSLTSVNPTAFKGCTGITKVVIPECGLSDYSFLKEIPSNATVYVTQEKYNLVKENFTGTDVRILDVTVSNIEPGIIATKFHLEVPSGLQVRSVKLGSTDVLKGPLATGEYSVPSAPETTFNITVNYIDLSGNDTNYISETFTTKSTNAKINVLEHDVLSNTIELSADTDETTGKIVSFKVSVQDSEIEIKPSEIPYRYKLGNLVPGSSLTIGMSVNYEKGTDYYGTRYVNSYTNKIPVQTTSQSGPTSVKISGTANDVPGAKFVGGFFSDSNGKNPQEISGNSILNKFGLTPQRDYAFIYNTVWTLSNGKEYKQQNLVELHTSELSLETQPAKATSEDCAILMANTNISDLEPGCGFEWRRYDAPNEMPSTESFCPAAGNHIVGRLNGLSKSTYYKFRAFYKDNEGNYYYGKNEWIAFITADAYVYFEPSVYTAEVASLFANGATLKGIAVEGSDAFISRGFELWKKNSSDYRVASVSSDIIKTDYEGTGSVMTCNISELEPSTTYVYRAYATTTKGTTRGDEMEFTTPKTLDIRTVEQQPSFKAKACYDGNTIRVMLNGEGENVICRIIDMNGSMINNANVIADGTWQILDDVNLVPGIYIINVVGGEYNKSVKIMIK